MAKKTTTLPPDAQVVEMDATTVAVYEHDGDVVISQVFNGIELNRMFIEKKFVGDLANILNKFK